MLLQAPDPTLQPGGSAGYIALLLVVLLFVATALLVRNMNGRLNRLPARFEAAPNPGRCDTGVLKQQPQLVGTCKQLDGASPDKCT